MVTTTEPRATRGNRLRVAHDHPHYKWLALSNTTLGVLMATSTPRS